MIFHGFQRYFSRVFNYLSNRVEQNVGSKLLNSRKKNQKSQILLKFSKCILGSIWWWWIIILTWKNRFWNFSGRFIKAGENVFSENTDFGEFHCRHNYGSQNIIIPSISKIYTPMKSWEHFLIENNSKFPFKFNLDYFLGFSLQKMPIFITRQYRVKAKISSYWF